MKPTLVLTLMAVVLVLFQGCTDNGSNALVGDDPSRAGTVSLAFSSAPPEITVVVATITRPGYDPRLMQLAISDSSQGASGSFGNVPVGVWHLRVEALDNTGTVRYAGETDVNVLPQQNAQVTLQLLATTGGIDITVTWGPSPTPSGGLVAHYPFNGNANDVSGRGNHGVVLGAIPTADRHGNPNSALWFNGVNSRVVIQSSPSLNPTHQLTITFWVRVDTITDNYSPIIHKGGPEQYTPWLANREYAIHIKRHIEPIYYFQFHSAGDGSGQHTVLDSRGTTVPQWVFVAAVVDRMNHLMCVYMDGVLTGTSPDSYSSFNTNGYPVTIGMEAETGWPDHSPLKGALDELRIYNRALSPAEIQALFSSN